MRAEVDIGIHAGKKLAVAVLNVNFNQHGAGIGIHGVGHANHLAFPHAALIFVEGNLCRHSHRNKWHARLRHAGQDAQSRGLGHTEEFIPARSAIGRTGLRGCALTAARRRDERTRLYVSRRNDPGERCLDLPEFQ